MDQACERKREEEEKKNPTTLRLFVWNVMLIDAVNVCALQMPHGL